MVGPKPLIAIDIDDTITGSTESVRLMVNRRLNINLPPEAYEMQESDYWGYYERVWEANDISGQITYSDFADEMINDQSLMPLLPSAEFAISQLVKEYDVVLITARDKSWEDATRRWLASNIGENIVEVYFTTSHNDKASMTKGQLCRHLGASLLIDDNVDHCRGALDEGIEAILFGSYGWNFTAPKNMTRCVDWPAVLKVLEGQVPASDI